MLALSGLVACGDEDDGSNLSDQEVEQVFTALGMTDFTTAQTMVDGSGNGSVACPDGGTISASGTVEQMSYSITIGFNDCGANGYVFNGSLMATGSTTSSGDSTSSFDGRISFVGPVTGSCLFDYSINAMGQSVTVTGSVCGRSL
ncbi:MAG: hypothetical protein AAF449_16575 [Myxococcota bacterium]